MDCHIVIGKNFGDEGKGLAVDYFSRRAMTDNKSCLVIRHNGGAQAGHTVDALDGRFVFHQLSSGSFCNADTFWADTFMPDLFKLREEAGSFLEIHGRLPRIMTFGGCRCVTVDDVLLNMALESSRAGNRHGSCGMGINEAVVRSADSGLLLSLDRVMAMTHDGLYREMKRIRREWLPLRLNELGLSLDCCGEYGELLKSDNVLYNAAEEMCRGAELVEPVSSPILNGYDETVFEGAQGLLLDELYLDYAPHLTSSRTGLEQPLAFCAQMFGGVVPEAVYVTRSYVTRHGRGPLPYEGGLDTGRYPVTDRTNIPNEWQESLRFASHGTYREFIDPVLADIGGAEASRSLLVTHLNETGGKIITANGELGLEEWCDMYRIREHFGTVYLSASPFSGEITKL